MCNSNMSRFQQKRSALSAGRICARPLQVAVEKMHPSALLEELVERLFGEMTNSRGGGFPWGKPGKRRYLGMEQILGCSSPPITAKSLPTGDTDLPKSFTQWGQHGQLRAFSTFQFHTFNSPLNSNITLKPKNIPGMKKTF